MRNGLMNSRSPRGGVGRNAVAAVVLAAVTFALAEPALAQAAASGSSDWAKPITDILVDLTSGGVQIGGWLIGLGMIVAACWGGITGRMDWQRVGMIIVAGVLIFFGPAMLKLLFHTS